VSRNRHRLIPESSPSSGGEKKAWKAKCGGSGGRADHGEKKEPVVKLTTMGTPRRKGRCRNYGIYGHWAEDCKKTKKECKEEAHHVEADAMQASLLLATVNAVHVASRDVKPPSLKTTRQVVHLNEKKVHPADGDADEDV